MDMTKADAMAAAVLDRPLAEQQALQRRRQAQADALAEKRRIARFSLVGMGLGAATAWVLSQPLSLGLLWGGLIASGVGWIVLGLTRRR